MASLIPFQPFDPNGSAIRVLHPFRDIALCVQPPPDIDVIYAFNVEYQIRIASQFSAAQPRKGELMRVSRGAQARMIGNTSIGRLQGLDESQCRVRSGFFDVMINGCLDIPPSQPARHYSLGAHSTSALRSGLRSGFVFTWPAYGREPGGF